jgi:hypothetical protein
MRAEFRDYQFRLLLPAAQVLLCLNVLWLIRGTIVPGVRSSIRAIRSGTAYTEPPRVASRLRILVDPGEMPVPGSVTQKLIGIPAMLNLPAAMVEIPQAMLSPTHNNWIPKGMDFRIWRAISWPLIGIVFWWVAGRGIDALVGARRRLIAPSISWAETGLALATLACGIVFCMGPFMAREDRDSAGVGLWWPMLSGAGAMWALLATVTIAARITQWRIRRQIAAPTKN